MFLRVAKKKVLTDCQPDRRTTDNGDTLQFFGTECGTVKGINKGIGIYIKSYFNIAIK